MNPAAMGTLLAVGFGLFGVSAVQRWRQLCIGRPAFRWDHPWKRLSGMLRSALLQEKLHQDPWLGVAHTFVSFGFCLLLLRTLVLWGRGFDPAFHLFLLAPWTRLGQAYNLMRELTAVLVLVGVGLFLYARLVQRKARLTLSTEALLLLWIVGLMMASDLFYDAALPLLHARHLASCQPPPTASPSFCATIGSWVAPLGTEPQTSWLWSPCSRLLAPLLSPLPSRALLVLAQSGFWGHVLGVLVLLNMLPHSKHLHILTALPNLFFRPLTPPGRLIPMAETTAQLLAQVEVCAELSDPTTAPLGVARLEHFSRKQLLDLYTCTECGRCSEQCPAHLTGKPLSPKAFTLSLREYLIHNGQGVLVPGVIAPETLWACTTCRACEEECPVGISYVDKIVDLRRNLVTVQGEVPSTLQKPFQAMEAQGNPWGRDRTARSTWADGLGLPTFAQRPSAAVLYWVGCAASYDPRAMRIARATAQLLQLAGVDVAILGQEEHCTGDPARRVGNEFLFATLAEANAQTLRKYQEQGGIRTVVATCPHCFNTLKNEYQDVGIALHVVPHTDYLLGLLAEKKLTPHRPAPGKVVYHDSCYLGRTNGVYESPRALLRAIPGVELVEAEGNRARGLCCGAGGGQMWMEEQTPDRIHTKRTLQLLETKPHTLASACPFCMTMLTEGLQQEQNDTPLLDVAELLWQSCAMVVKEEAVGPSC